MLGAGAALLEPIGEEPAARPGSESRAEVRDGPPRNLRDPMSRHGAAVGPGSESISDPGSDVGSRSVLVVPMTTGNPAHGDPAEGRGTPLRQSRRWETRRAP